MFYLIGKHVKHGSREGLWLCGVTVETEGPFWGSYELCESLSQNDLEMDSKGSSRAMPLEFKKCKEVELIFLNKREKKNNTNNETKQQQCSNLEILAATRKK